MKKGEKPVERREMPIQMRKRKEKRLIFGDHSPLLVRPLAIQRIRDRKVKRAILPEEMKGIRKRRRRRESWRSGSIHPAMRDVLA